MGCQQSKTIQVHPEEPEVISFNGKTESPTPVLNQVDTNQLRQFIKTKHGAVAISASTSHNFRNSSQNKDSKGSALLGNRYKFHESTGSLEELKDPPVQIYLVTDRSIGEINETFEEKPALERNPTVDEQEDMEIRKVGMLSGASSMAFQIPDNVGDGPITYKDAYSLIKKGQESNTKSSDPNVKTLQKVWTSNNSICFAPLIFSAAGSIHTNQTNETDSVLVVEKEDRPLRKSFTTYKMKNETLMENTRPPYMHENVAKALDLKGMGDPSNYTSAPFPVEFFANKITAQDKKQAIQNENMSDIRKRLIEVNFHEEVSAARSKDSVDSQQKQNIPPSIDMSKKNSTEDSTVGLGNSKGGCIAEAAIANAETTLSMPDNSIDSNQKKTNSVDSVEDSLDSTGEKNEDANLNMRHGERNSTSSESSEYKIADIQTIAEKKASVVSLICLPEGPKLSQNSKSFPILYGFQESKAEPKKIATVTGINVDPNPNSDIFMKSLRKDLPLAFNTEPVKYSSIVASGDMLQ
ncbi:hypothetical protein HDV06_003264 [Boothiomyces sp. JEL0866]|nr:hypothetical protein HDV06_003264 [Boothiomyces sp. JEL0866]